MKAIRVYLDDFDTDYIGSVVERMNKDEDIVVTMVDANELFIAAVGECAIKYAETIVRTSFNGDLTIKPVK